MTTYTLYGVDLAVSEPLRAPLPRSSSTPGLFVAFDRRRVLEQAASLPEPLWQSQTRSASGAPQRIFFGLDDHLLVRYSDVGDYYVSATEIRCCFTDCRQRDLLEIYLLGPILSLWLELRGTICLHAAGLEVNGVGLALLAESGAGKSTLAAHMIDLGVRLLSDDILPVEAAGPEFSARPGYPQMRMWPDLARRMLRQWEHLPRVLADVDKRRVPVGNGGFGSFCAEARPLRRLYLLRRQAAASRAAEPIVITPLRGHSALLEVIRHSFSAIAMDALRLQAGRLQRLGALIGAVPMREVVYPTGHEHLNAVRSAILCDALE